jgi:CRISPR-associated protein Csm4
MRTYRIDLAVPSGFVTPWHSDTLFGHLCWAAERQGQFRNFKGAAGLIELFRGGEPPFVLSDGFPAGLLPAPVTLQSRYASELQEGMDSERYSLLKKAKKREYLTSQQFQVFRSGGTPDLSRIAEGFMPVTTLHNRISRFTNTTGDAGSLFERDEIYAPDGRVQIYAKVRDGFEDDLRQLFELVAHAGFGAKKSSGKGSFSIENFAPFADFDTLTGANGFVTLSHLVPAQGDPTDGAWRTTVKYGKLGEEKTFYGNPFKKPLVMLKPGAVFRAETVRSWYGRLVEGIAYGDSSIIQAGFAFAVPISLGVPGSGAWRGYEEGGVEMVLRMRSEGLRTVP